MKRTVRRKWDSNQRLQVCLYQPQLPKAASNSEYTKMLHLCHCEGPVTSLVTGVVSLSLSLSLTHTHALSLSHTHTHTHTHTTLTLSLSLSVSLSFSLSLPLSLSHTQALSLSLSDSLSLTKVPHLTSFVTLACSGVDVYRKEIIDAFASCAKR